MRLVLIGFEAGIFFDKCDWSNGSAYEAIAELRSTVPRNKLKFDYDVMGWFIDVTARHHSELLDRLHLLVKKYDQTNVDAAQWDWDQKELKSKKKNDIYVWLYKQDHKKVKSAFTKKQKKNLMAQWNDPHRVANIILNKSKRVEIVI